MKRSLAVLDQRFDDLRYFLGIERGSDHLADGGLVALLAADGDLVPLLIILVDAEDADVGHVVVAAGVHAAGDVERDVADVEQVVEIVELLVHRLRGGCSELPAADQLFESCADAADRLLGDSCIGVEEAHPMAGSSGDLRDTGAHGTGANDADDPVLAEGGVQFC